MRRLSLLLLALIFALNLNVAEAKKKSGGTPAAHFDYYVLALSWSPEFCTTSAGKSPPKAEQCSKPFGFVVHGLWPQFNNGKWPQNCNPKAKKTVPSDIADIALNADPPMPPGDPDLLNHEWMKHGTCSGLDQKGYFTKIKDAAEKVSIPPELKQPTAPLKMDFKTIASKFGDSNPGLKTEMLDSSADNKGNVSEIHVCFSKDLAFQACKGSTNQDEGGTFLPVKQ